MILIIAPVNDIPTSISLIAARHLESFCNEKRVYSKMLFGPMAYRAIFETTMLLEENIDMIAYYGHGVNDGLLGQHYFAKMMDTRNNYFAKNKVIYTMACRSNNILGPNSIEKGAIAYFGAKDWYFGAIPNEEYDYLSDWIDTVTIVPKTMILGKTSIEALDYYRLTIEKYIDKYKNNKYLDYDWYLYAFRSNLDNFNLLGNTTIRLSYARSEQIIRSSL